MFEEKLAIIPAPIHRAISNAHANESVLLDPDQMLTILSMRDVLTYIHVNTALLTTSYSSDSATPEAEMTSALRDLSQATLGVTNFFTQPKWAAFMELHADELKQLRELGLSLYEYLTGETYTPDTDLYTYDIAPKIVAGELVGLFIHQNENKAVFDMNARLALFAGVLHCLHMLCTDTIAYFSLYKAYCELVYQNSLIQRFSQ